MRLAAITAVIITTMMIVRNRDRHQVELQSEPLKLMNEQLISTHDSIGDAIEFHSEFEHVKNERLGEKQLLLWQLRTIMMKKWEQVIIIIIHNQPQLQQMKIDVRH